MHWHDGPLHDLMKSRGRACDFFDTKKSPGIKNIWWAVMLHWVWHMYSNTNHEPKKLQDGLSLWGGVLCVENVAYNNSYTGFPCCCAVKRRAINKSNPPPLRYQLFKINLPLTFWQECAVSENSFVHDSCADVIPCCDKWQAQKLLSVHVWDVLCLLIELENNVPVLWTRKLIRNIT